MTASIDTYRVAAVQFEPRLGAKAENIARLLDLTEAAARGGARLIVLPEMATTGYCWHSRDEVRPQVEPIPGPTTAAFAALAHRFACFIVVGMPEVAPRSGMFYNSAALLGPDGVVGVYRKTHSYIADLTWASDGNLGLPVWDTPLGRIGVLICMDAGYFEPARLLALAGADVLCFPTNWLNDKSPGPAWLARAFENGCYLIGANRYGVERGVQFSGGSCVLNPDGTVQAMRDTGDGIVLGAVSLAAARAKAFGAGGPPEKLTARRPTLYDNLTRNSYLWNPLALHGLYNHRPLPLGRRASVAVAQFTPVPGDLETNAATIEELLVELHTAGVELVVFPEYALTGAHPRAALLAAEAARWCARFGALAQQQALHLVVGYAEREDGQTFSTALLIGPAGVIASYRKTHVIGAERAWCSAGAARPPVVDLPLGRVGLLIDSDLCFPEMARGLAIEGCDLLAVAAGAGVPAVRALGPTAVPLHPPGVIGHDPTHFHLARQRAVENNSYVAFASVPHPHGSGCSAVFGPERAGETLLDARGCGSSMRVIDTGDRSAPMPELAAVRAKELVRMRQTHLYEPLQTDSNTRH